MALRIKSKNSIELPSCLSPSLLLKSVLQWLPCSEFIYSHNLKLHGVPQRYPWPFISAYLYICFFWLKLFLPPLLPILFVLLIPTQTSHPQRRLLVSPLWSGHICLSQVLHSIFPTARFTFMCDYVMTFVSLEYKLCGSGSHVALCSPLYPCAWHMVNAQ